MKRLMCLLVALMVAPAMAGVTISVVDNGDLTADIVVVADGDDADANGSLIAGIALDVSVDAGQILEVSNYKITGESVVGDKGYGIFLGTITFTGDDPVMIEDTGTPVAPADAPDNPPQLPGPACVLEFGALYDQAVPEAAPEATTVLCKIAVSEACNMTLAANSTRGGVVRIGGGAVAANFVGGPITGSAPEECMKPSHPDYERWVQFGKPDCWCYKYQCKGDADGKNQGNVVTGFYPVGTLDIEVLLTAYLVREANIGAIPGAICADFDRKSQGNIVTGYYPVGTDDINVLLDSYLVREANMTECDATHINFWIEP